MNKQFHKDLPDMVISQSYSFIELFCDLYIC